jgi:ectoine hydroxylase-related dioxygenase (phytanoyl-CoA dioxygenase family)
MPRPASTPSIDALVRDALDGVVKRASVAIARTLAQLTAERLEAELATEVARAGRGRSARRARHARGVMSRWAADRRARRVPNFVIDMTGLKTKKQIVAKYGEGVVFEKGKSPPKAKG